ncbi:hypothetical protein BJX70DRAFT_369690 [Aspergillus crustosus]
MIPVYRQTSLFRLCKGSMVGAEGTKTLERAGSSSRKRLPKSSISGSGQKMILLLGIPSVMLWVLHLYHRHAMDVRRPCAEYTLTLLT